MVEVKWLMLIYKLPRSRTTAKKLAIWRKLKRLGVYSPQDSVFVLPYSERTLEHFEWLGEEIREMGGEVALWEFRTLEPLEEEKIRAYFLEQVDGQYRSVMAGLAAVENIEQLQEQWAIFNRIRTQDYLKSPLGTAAKQALEHKAAQMGRRD